MPRFGVIVFPGSNCDYDCYNALKNILTFDCGYIWHEEQDLSEFDCIVIPGGFSYGDYLRTGSIARFSPVMESVRSFAENGKPVIGICNGFQILVESGILPGAFLKNNSLKFVCKWTYLSIENTNTPFTFSLKQGEVLKIPVAHGEGNYFIEDQYLESLISASQVVFRYSDEKGEANTLSNPNGSVYNIAGICNSNGNVLGMMPHPERSCEELIGGSDGRLIFESVYSWIESQ